MSKISKKQPSTLSNTPNLESTSLQKSIPKFIRRICGNRDYKTDDKIFYTTFSKAKHRAIVVGLANFPDIYNWYIIRLKGFSKPNNYVVARHDQLKPRLKRVKNVGKH